MNTDNTTAVNPIDTDIADTTAPPALRFIGDQENIGQLVAAVSKVKAEIGGGIRATGYNKQDGFGYKSIDDISRTIQPLTGKHGLMLIPTTGDPWETQARAEWAGRDSKGVVHRLRVQLTLLHESGAGIQTQVVAQAFVNRDKGVNACIAYAVKYFWIVLLELGAEDPDNISRPEQGNSDRNMTGQSREPGVRLEWVTEAAKKALSDNWPKRVVLFAFEQAGVKGAQGAGGLHQLMDMSGVLPDERRAVLREALLQDPELGLKILGVDNPRAEIAKLTEEDEAPTDDSPDGGDDDGDGTVSAADSWEDERRDARGN